MVKPPDEETGEDEQLSNRRETAISEYEAKLQEIVNLGMGKQAGLWDVCLDIYGSKGVGQSLFSPRPDGTEIETVGEKRKRKRLECDRKKKEEESEKDAKWLTDAMKTSNDSLVMALKKTPEELAQDSAFTLALQGLAKGTHKEHWKVTLAE